MLSLCSKVTLWVGKGNAILNMMKNISEKTTFNINDRGHDISYVPILSRHKIEKP